MEHLARIRTRLGRAGVAAVLAALLVPALAGTATAQAKHHKHAAAHAKHHQAKHHKAKHKKAKKKSKLPVITSVRPMHAAVGDTLTIRGHNFRRGLNKNTVIFMRDGGRPVFVKAAKGTTKMLRVTLPAALADALRTKSGVPVATRFRLRVLAARFGKAFTSRKHSPLIDPEKAPGSHPAPSPAAPQADCDGDGTINANDADDDNDLLPDTVEAALKTDPCRADTDGDGVADGFEYRSALDLNDDEYQNKATVPQNEVLPYPGKRPYPNPLDPTDAGTDYDGDSLQLGEEYRLWQYTIAHEGAPYDLSQLTYSDGTQYSLYSRDAQGRRHPAVRTADYDKHQQFVDWATANGYRSILIYRGDTAHWYTTYDRANDPEYNAHDGLPTTSIFDVNLDGTDDDTSTDFDHDGYVSDDERDEDADGLSNYDETHGRMTPGYWTGCYKSEAAYPVTYVGTDPTNPDSDGDGVRDGADDQDHDEIPNVMELSRIAAASGSVNGTVDDRKRPLRSDCTADPDQLPKPPLGNHEDMYGWVNPFNPCLPSQWSRTCSKYRVFGADYAPFADGTPDWWALN
jgi:hypothetical protein